MASHTRTGAETDLASAMAAYRARASVRRAAGLCAAALATLGSREGAHTPTDLGAARRALHAPACALLRAALAAERTCVAALLLLRALYHDQPALCAVAAGAPSFEELGWRAARAPPAARAHWRGAVTAWAAAALAHARTHRTRPNPYALFLAAYYADRVDGAYAAAVPLLRAAADGAALAAAHNCLGSFCEFGDGVPRDARAAIAHFRCAAAHAHAGAQCNLGSLLTDPNEGEGNGGEGNGGNGNREEVEDEARVAEGVALLRASIAQGHAGARVRLAQLYLTARGVAFDVDTALALLDAARAARCLDALVLAATLVLLDVDTRTPRAAAPALLRRAARRGHEEAMHRLGLYHAGELGNGNGNDNNGTGTAAGVRTHPRRAAHWFAAAAAGGHADAAERLARLTLAGRGTRRSPAAALALLARAERLGAATAAATRAAHFGECPPAPAAPADVLPALAAPALARASARAAANTLELYAECAAAHPDSASPADIAAVVLPALVRRPSWKTALTLSVLARIRLPYPSLSRSLALHGSLAHVHTHGDMGDRRGGRTGGAARAGGVPCGRGTVPRARAAARTAPAVRVAARAPRGARRGRGTHAAARAGRPPHAPRTGRRLGRAAPRQRARAAPRRHRAPRRVARPDAPRVAPGRRLSLSQCPHTRACLLSVCITALCVSCISLVLSWLLGGV